MDLKNWPVVNGRYTVINPRAPVAVCTLANFDIELKSNDIAIYGKCVTENIGIERVILNTVSNPNIRFLLLCGLEPEGHFVGQAIKCVKENGVGEGNRIVGARGAMPYLKNLSPKEIEAFRKQIEVVDLIGTEDAEEIEGEAGDCAEKNPGPFGAGAVTAHEVKEILAKEGRPWVPDKKGYFVVMVDRKKDCIVVEHYDYANKLDLRVIGKTVEEFRDTLCNLDLFDRFDHAFYLGKEIQKAEIALKTGAQYEQQKKFY